MLIKAVGLVVMMRIRDKPVAILQRRGEFNTEKMALETNPGVWQATMHETLRPDESFETGLNRGIFEELGKEAASILYRPETEIIHEWTNENYLKRFYWVSSDPNILRVIRLETSTGGIRPFTLKEVGQMTPLRESDAVKPEHKWVMFDTALEAVKKAFVRYIH
ncbi:MAG: hypothetical protein A3G59_00105 [Candidatus Taylorbacteria bacterium RIFCSPLOWO2_12_FULL_47_20]|uniref:Nudix hydrolase domain-containing protein n=2 Tax=Candidatus Tayloriibacteriota TaxID=1817919 RepID=A0A1G2P919_9BACT|nr:MAG: hypothetical protein A3H68_00180 [Candidatus Taylorbacteria bacterium RIFCSPLOWO2_02_FULL_46_40]OHA44209.1 MAG: hypothetical protein A3G59_00105 [Candidatus Taylorbacteria bacterium RIFCSPLOWO2_12_FULL_47_20]